MRLQKFRVTDFRSVKDSGWVDVDSVTALIGENESGKSNLLLPLWKLNPAREGELQPTADYPKSIFAQIRANPADYAFITAHFDCQAAAEGIASSAGITTKSASEVVVTRYYDGSFDVEFPNYDPSSCIDVNSVRQPLSALLAKVDAGQPAEQEAALLAQLKTAIPALLTEAPADATVSIQTRAAIIARLQNIIADEPAKAAATGPLAKPLIDDIKAIIAQLTKPAPTDDAVVKAVVAALPKFVYYANYGNLDSEIYLPHVVENLKRTDLGTKEAAKARTLRVLFKFVGLEPQEILQLGRESPDASRPPNAAEVGKIAEAKRTRFILMQSAETRLTKEFRAWWKRGDYNFTFAPDGNHFRIWVSDDRRPDKVELESRSTGLQWFLSFFLVFLVESEEAHKSAILLLDEPGMSLHPLAQRDLSDFFDSLSQSNQLLYTSHSPFLVQPDRLDRARKIYVDTDGTTKASADLRRSAGDPQPGAAYAVHSALNLNIAESLLIGCTPIIVDGPSDQHYLTTIKTLLVSSGAIKPKTELVFPPAGGAKNARITAGILTGRDEQLPIILCDDDAPGRSAARGLRSSLYAEAPERLLSIRDYVFDGSEVEDLFPSEFLADIVDRMVKRPDVDLADTLKPNIPFVGQVEAWAKQNKIDLPQHWKVNLALDAKRRALQRGIEYFKPDIIQRWIKLFEAFTGRGQS